MNKLAAGHRCSGFAAKDRLTGVQCYRPGLDPRARTGISEDQPAQVKSWSAGPSATTRASRSRPRAVGSAHRRAQGQRPLIAAAARNPAEISAQPSTSWAPSKRDLSGRRSERATAGCERASAASFRSLSPVANGRLNLGPKSGATSTPSKPINHRVTVKELGANDDILSEAPRESGVGPRYCGPPSRRRSSTVPSAA